MTITYDWLAAHVGHSGTECLIWPFSCSTPGYGQGTQGGKTFLAHRLMCELVHGKAPTMAHHAAHSCGNRRCVNPDHLSWKTQSANQLDRIAQGRPFTGRAKQLTADQVREIRALTGSVTRDQLAERFGCTESNIRHIQNGATYRDVR